MGEFESLKTEAIDAAVRSMRERIDKEVLGAWRAGYDYLHVYDGLHHRGMGMNAFSIKQYVLPSDVETPPRPEFAVYKHTFVLDDEEVQQAIDDRRAE